MAPHVEEELAKILQWNPGLVYDPVPEWWIRELGEEVQRELIAIRLETLQRVLQANVDGLGKATEILRSRAQ